MRPNSGSIVLSSGGKQYSGFSSMSFSKELTGVVHGFNLEITDVNALDSIPDFLKNDVLVQLFFNDVLLTIGYIDSTNSTSDFKLQITGRSKASRLVDCSVDKKQYNNITIQNLAHIICSPYGILFVDETGLTKTKDIKSEGESGLELLKKWLEGEDVWLSSTSTGDIVLKNKPKKTSAKYVYGENVYSYSVNYDYTNVFSEYTVYSSQNENLKQDTTPHAIYKDKYFNGYKNKSIESSGAKDKASCFNEAKKASASAKSRMMTLSMEVPVYRDKTSMMNDVGDIVFFYSKIHGIERDFVINRITYDVSSTSFKSDIDLVDKDAFSTVLQGSNVLVTFDGAFAKAFARARREGLKVFLWRGKNYNTFLKEEWDAR